MQNALISRRALLQASAAVYAATLAPAPVFARSAGAAIPDGYAVWIRHRGRQGWTVTCASRSQPGQFLPFSVASVPVQSFNHYGQAPIALAQETIRADFARRAGLPPESLSFNGGYIHGDRLRVPLSIWVDFA